MEKYRIRPYSPLDAQAVVDLINAASVQTVGFPRAVVDAVGNLWAYRFTPFTSEKMVAITESNEVVGYAFSTSNDDPIAGEIGGAVHPNYWNKGIGSALIEWAESRAGAVLNHVPADIKTVLQTSFFETEYDAIRLFKEAGYFPVREWVHLAIELTEPPVIPSLPTGLTLREMDLDNDWDIVSPAMDEAFTDHWGVIPEGSVESVEEKGDERKVESESEPVDKSYSNALGYCFIVLDGSTVVGGILCNAKLVERNDTGRIGSIFVRPAYRKRGIAQTLMLAAFDAFWKNGFRRVVTDTDVNSFTDSTRLYKGLGMILYRSELTFEKEIRPGREVRRLEM